MREISLRNANFFEEEATKLDNWAEDLKITLEREISDIDRQIKEAKRSSLLSASLEDKLANQKNIRNLEGIRNLKRKALFEAQDEIDRKREAFIEQLEGKLQQKTTTSIIMKMGWQLQ